MTTKSFGKPELDALIEGSAVLGSGGGGTLQIASFLEAAILQQLGTRAGVEVEDLLDIEDDALVVAIGVAAAQDAHPPNGLDPVKLANHAVDLLQQYEPKQFTHVLPLELGAGSSLLPMLLGASRDMKVVDASGARRAVAFLNMTTFAQVSLGPMAITNGNADYVFHPASAQAAEADFTKLLTSPNFPFGVYVIWPMSGSELKTTAIGGSLTYALNLGNAVAKLSGQTPAANGADPVQQVTTALGGSIVCRGTVNAVSNRPVRGLAGGHVELRDDTTGREITVYFVNENIAAVDSATHAVLAQGPDLICWLGQDGSPLMNPLQVPPDATVAVVKAAVPESTAYPVVAQAFDMAFAEISKPQSERSSAHAQKEPA